MSVKWMWHHGRRYGKRISLLASGLLSGEEMIALEAHVSQCPDCRRRYGDLKRLCDQLTQAGQALPEMEPSAALQQRWMQAVEARPGSDGESAATGAVFAWEWYRWLAQPRAAWAGLVLVWGLILVFNITTPNLPGYASRQVAPTPSLVLRLLRAQRAWVAEHYVGTGATGNSRGTPWVFPGRRSQERERTLVVA